MQSHSTILDQNTWSIHLNFEGHFVSPQNYPSWLTQLQQQDWQRQGVVLCDADMRIGEVRQFLTFQPEGQNLMRAATSSLCMSQLN